MGIIKRMRKQDAVYWEPGGLDKFGHDKFLEPVDIKCRWQSAGMEDVKYTTVTVKVTDAVYPDRALIIGGRLMKGTRATVLSRVDAPPPPESKRIEGVGEIPNLRNTEILYLALL